jgi:hypothetical protein
MIFPFYEKALDLFKRTQKAQIIKGLQKYPEPFNPHSWTPDELLTHALEETVDLTHYLVGLRELIEAKDKEISDLKARLEKPISGEPGALMLNPNPISKNEKFKHIPEEM